MAGLSDTTILGIVIAGVVLALMGGTGGFLAKHNKGIEYRKDKTGAFWHPQQEWAASKTKKEVKKAAKAAAKAEAAAAGADPAGGRRRRRRSSRRRR